MKLPILSSYLAAQLVFLLAPLSTAQDLSSLPSCAQTPALAALGTTGCQSSDFACICQNSDFINTALAGARSACSEGDFQRVLSFAQQLCSGAGVTISGDATSPASPSQTSVPTASQTTTPATSQNVVSGTATSSEGRGTSSTAAAATAATTSAGTSDATRDKNMAARLVWGMAVVVGSMMVLSGCGWMVI